MKWSQLGLLGLLLSSSIFANTNPILKPSLILNQIKMVRQGEYFNDNLYFDISILRTNQPTKYIRIPEYPFYLQSSRINALKPTTLWSESIENGQKVILIASLMDQDSRPLNPDDVIGFIRVELKNDNGNLHSSWNIPNQKSPPKIGTLKTAQKFELSNDNGHYEVYLSLDK